jgi:hypothetical protein
MEISRRPRRQREIRRSHKATAKRARPRESLCGRAVEEGSQSSEERLKPIRTRGTAALMRDHIADALVAAIALDSEHG